MEDVAMYLVKSDNEKDMATLHKMVQDALQYAASMGIGLRIQWIEEESDDE